MNLLTFKRRLGVWIESFGAMLDRIPSWPWYRSKATIARLDAEDEEFYKELGWDPDPDEEPRQQWFGVISGYGCRWGICRFGIDLQDS